MRILIDECLSWRLARARFVTHLALYGNSRRKTILKPKRAIAH